MEKLYYHADSPSSPLLQKHSEIPTIPQDLSTRLHQPTVCHRRLLPYLLHAFLLSISLTLFITTLYLRSHSSTLSCLHLTSSYSPALPSIRHQLVQFNPNIINSPYVGPTLDVDLQWGKVNFGDQMISRPELLLLHKDPETSMPVTDPKTGEQGYRIGLEVFHQLHCLNMLRKATYVDYSDEYSGGDFGVGKEELRGHLDHCIEMLRMNLMCHADVGVITFKRVEGGEEGHDRRRRRMQGGGAAAEWEPDFASWHVCRDYEMVREWAVERVVATDPV